MSFKINYMNTNLFSDVLFKIELIQLQKKKIEIGKYVTF